MTLAEYESLTGTTVPATQADKVTAQLARVQSHLETLLGYPLSESEDDRFVNHYIELGKSNVECHCSNIDVGDLDDPDPIEWAYRLYPYNGKDNYFHVDPFTILGAVKLVHDGITVKVFDPDDIRADFGKDLHAMYIEICNECMCVPDCGDSCVQLAVDAKWGYETLPVPLQYLLTDMVDYYTNNRGVVSQSVLGHSYTLGDDAKTAPENKSSSLHLLRQYAGYYGTVTKRPTV